MAKHELEILPGQICRLHHSFFICRLHFLKSRSKSIILNNNFSYQRYLLNVILIGGCYAFQLNPFNAKPRTFDEIFLQNKFLGS